MKEAGSGDAGSKAELTELIERRAMIQQWLAGLEAQRGTAPARILDRVRADYESRLAETLATLAHHADAVRAELEAAIVAATDAEREHLEASDALEEGRLRHSIGEVSEEVWTDRKAALVEAVDRAREAEEQARAEADRLRELVARLSKGDGDGLPAPAATPAGEPESGPGLLSETPAVDVAAAHASGFDDPDATVESWNAPEAEASLGDSEAFLAEIDRALSGPSPDSDEPFLPKPPENAPDADEEEVDTAPKPGLKCGECGYTNDLSAWFCGVCGADVG